MCLFVQMGFDSFNGCGHGTVAALFVQTLEASKNALGQNGLLFLDGLDILVLLFLFQEPFVHGKDCTENDAESSNRCRDCGNIHNVFLLPG